jgi:hypothetical protein
VGALLHRLSSTTTAEISLFAMSLDFSVEEKSYCNTDEIAHAPSPVDAETYLVCGAVQNPEDNRLIAI